jgi:hypothetical protein
VQPRGHGWEKQRRASRHEGFKTGYLFTRDIIALLIIVLAIGSPAAAKCCSLGGGASYDFLGDADMDIGMESYDRFVSEEPALSVVATSDVKEAAKSRIRLNLSNNSRIYLLLTSAKGSIHGQGNVTQGNVTGPAEAVGRLQANKLSLDVTALSGEVFKFSLAAEGSSVLGDYSLALPDGEKLNATAEGKWEI